VDYEGNRELVNCSFHPVLLRWEHSWRLA
jgi:hypothetical protein